MAAQPRSNKRGRKLNPVIGHGPVHEFVRGLRNVLLGDEERTQAEVAKDANVSRSTVSAVCSDNKLAPSEAVVNCLKGAGVTDQETLDEWIERHGDAMRAAAAFQPSFSDMTFGELVDQLRRLVARQRLDVADLRARIEKTLREIASAKKPEKMRRHAGLPAAAPERDELDGVLGRRDPLSAATLEWIVFAAGGTRADRAYWADRLRRVEKEPAPEAQVRDTGVVPAGELPGPTAPPTAARPAAGARIGGTRRRERLRTLLLVSGIGLVAVGVFGLPPLLRDDRGAGPTGSAPTGGPATDPTTPTARRILTEIAGRVCVLPDVADRRSFIYIRRISWSLETTNASSQGVAGDERTWWNPEDRSGLRTTSSTRPNSKPTGGLEHFGPGQFKPAIEGAPPTDPAALIELITADHPPRIGPARVIRGVRDLNDYFVLSPAQRCALMRGLADAPGLVYRDQGLDQMERPGIAISGDDTFGQRDELIIDPADGQVLGHNSYNSSGETPFMISSVAYAERGFTDRIG